MPRPRTLPMVNLGIDTGNVRLRVLFGSRLFGTGTGFASLYLRRYGLQASLYLSNNQLTTYRRDSGGSLSLDWRFVVCGTLMRHPRKWLFVLPGATNRAMSALSGSFRVHNAACGMCTRIQPYRAGCVRVYAYPRGGGLTANSDETFFGTIYRPHRLVFLFYTT